MLAMNASALDETTTNGTPATARPYLSGGLAALSAGAAAIHFAVTFEHFSENLWYGAFFLVIAWAQLIWAAVAVWRLLRWWLWLGIAGNAMILGVYLASRTTGLPLGPDQGHTEPFGALDVTCALLELVLIAGCAALLWRPSLADRPVRRRTGLAAIARMAAIPRRRDRGDHGGDDPRLGRPGGTGGHGVRDDGVVVRGARSAARHG